jgi:hypothetical protein
MVRKEGNEVANFASCALRNAHEREVRRGEERCRYLDVMAAEMEIVDSNATCDDMISKPDAHLTLLHWFVLVQYYKCVKIGYPYVSSALECKVMAKEPGFISLMQRPHRSIHF